MPMNVRIVGAYALMCGIWGTTWLAIKIGLQGLPPVSGAGIRFLIAGLFLASLGALAGPRRGTAPPLSLILTLAVAMFGGNYALTYYAETGLSSGLVAVLFGTLPFFVFGLGAVMLGERATLSTLVGAVLALAGVSIISLGGDVHGGAWFAAATLGASLLSAYANVYLRRHAASDPFATLAPAMLLAGAVMTISGVVFERPDWHAALATRSVLAVLYLAIMGSGIAFYLNHWLLQRLESWVVGLSALVIPIIAVAVGIAFGGETFGFRDVVGAALVVGGVAFALRRERSPEPIEVRSS